jgi:hypothetical protein
MRSSGALPTLVRMSRTLLFVSMVAVLAGCSESENTEAEPALDSALIEETTAADTGESDTETSVTSDSGAEATSDATLDAADGSTDGSAEAATDTGPLPVFVQVDDGTVALAHSHTCAPAIAFDAAGSPIVATTKSGILRVMRLVSGAWAQLGPDVNDAANQVENSLCVALAIAGDGTPWVGYVSRPTGAPTEGHVRHLVSGAWVDKLTVASTSSGFAAFYGVEILVDDKGDPIVVTAEPNTGLFDYAVTTRRLVGGAFVKDAAVGGSALAGMTAARRPGGNIVALVTVTAGFSTTMRELELSGTAWTDSGTALEITGDTTHFLSVGDIVADASHVWITWTNTASSGTTALHTMRRDGSTWTDIGTASEPGKDAHLAFHGGDDVTQTLSTGTSVMVRDHDGTKFGTAVKLPVDCTQTEPAYDHGKLYVSVAILAGGGTSGAVVYRLNLP